MATAPLLPTTNSTSTSQEKRHRSIFDAPTDFFDACRLLSLSSSPSSASASLAPEIPSPIETLDEADTIYKTGVEVTIPRWTCNTCKAEFDSLQDQRFHFKSDIHRINVKLSIAGKDIVKEEDFDESFKDCDISSVSGSEDEAEKASILRTDAQRGLVESVRQKLFVRLKTGEKASIWKSLVLNDGESVCFENDNVLGGCLRESEVIERLKFLIHEERNGTHLRIVLLASGGHFVGCVFDGNSPILHKTFHRYVVRAKAGKKQSSKDGTGRAAHSAGASLRRYNEQALKKDIQELLDVWKPYFDASSCIYLYAPSSNRQLLFDGSKAYFSNQHRVRNVPLSVRRPTLKEARRIYNQLAQVTYEVDEKESLPDTIDDLVSTTSTISNSAPGPSKEDLNSSINSAESAKPSSIKKQSDDLYVSSGDKSEVAGMTTPLHEAAQSGGAHQVLELLEQGLDPCIKDERGRTPYVLANDKEVRNTFRRFMALNIDRWDWCAANVPSALTKEMEESQAAKQTEKEEKRKARAKELKKLRKAREKKAQAEAASSQNAAAVVVNRAPPNSVIKGQSQPRGGSKISTEQERKSTEAIEREKRAAAAERRMAAAAAINAQSSSTSTVPAMAQPKSGLTSDITCSCCHVSLAGKVPFHRYNYKYCSSSCMHVHREILEDE
ncbi:ANKYRIN REPEAT AND ZINC FINGER DOMAIN-CONTAINING PROTEIN 1 [Salix viminalis]|uniref:ANKYRIN REPEAT AND ZINC FINGER DOMAIN-CONTAINING PROTEIN 1 n=1 Tax=Salix viminalis TaxID=40686 RepID=A0A9Q0UGV5_SALVM|nr:ANKYRIN REPEAT AND ZINC FINGER DOMAIN-CONTAINING PROTEIN 1 [Salix viminalis]